jgi:outer membrane immunogenic protein
LGWGISVKKIVLGALSALLLTSAANAQAPRVYNWTGFYIGGHFGGAWGDSSTASSDSVFAFPNEFGPVSADVSGFLAGGQLGYNYQVGRTVIGIEADISWTNADGQGTLATNSVRADYSYFSTFTGRLGHAFDRSLIYVKAGVAFTNVTNSAADSADPFDTTSQKNSAHGYVIGAGIEYAVAPSWTWKLEYNFLDFDVVNSRNVVDNDLYNHKNQIHAVKIGFNYRFGR